MRVVLKVSSRLLLHKTRQVWCEKWAVLLLLMDVHSSIARTGTVSGTVSGTGPGTGTGTGTGTSTGTGAGAGAGTLNASPSAIAHHDPVGPQRWTKPPHFAHGHGLGHPTPTLNLAGRPAFKHWDDSEFRSPMEGSG
jgi:hypothetical protein